MRMILVCTGGPDDARALATEVAAVSSRGPAVETTYTSSDVDAAETARLVAEKLGLAWPQTLKELDQPHSKDDLQALTELQDLVWSAIESLKEQHPQDAALVLVTHELPVRLLVCRALSIPLEDRHRFQIDAASLTTLEFRFAPQNRVILSGLNETCHLT